MKRKDVKRYLKESTPDGSAYMHSVCRWMQSTGLFFKDIDRLSYIKSQLFIYVKLNGRTLIGTII